jgi:hypothetical protein
MDSPNGIPKTPFSDTFFINREHKKGEYEEEGREGSGKCGKQCLPTTGTLNR